MEQPALEDIQQVNSIKDSKEGNVMGHFETKIACEVKANSPKCLSTHTCPTLRGISDAPVLNSEGMLIGIHVGGDQVGVVNISEWTLISSSSVDYESC